MIAEFTKFSLRHYGNNLFFEFDLIRGGIIAEAPIAPSEPRGVWVVVDGSQIWCRLFVNASEDDKSRGITGTSGHWFDFDKEKGLNLVDAAPQPASLEDAPLQGERQLLGFVLSLLAEVATGQRKLSPSDAAFNLPPYLILSEGLVAFP